MKTRKDFAATVNFMWHTHSFPAAININALLTQWATAGILSDVIQKRKKRIEVYDNGKTQ